MSGHLLEMVGTSAIIYTEKNKKPEWHIGEVQEKRKLDKQGKPYVVSRWFNWYARTNVDIETARKIAEKGRQGRVL